MERSTPFRESRYPLCPLHNLRYHPSQEGCTLCKRPHSLSLLEGPVSGSRANHTPPRYAPSSQSASTTNPIWWLLLIPAIFLVGLLLIFGALKAMKMAMPPQLSDGKGGTIAVSHMSVYQAFQKVKAERGKGQLQVIHFWATWCPSCVREMPHLKRVIERTHHKNVRYYMFAVNSPRRQVNAYGARYRFVPYRLTSKGASPGLAAELQGLGAQPSNKIPYTLVLDGSGNVVNQWVGARSTRYTLSVLQPHLKDASTL